ncbi:MAG TPA: glycosyltransferase [Solirubrobacteraceae bacterium]|nr:glycosyltransferase [Solirubrobacteraceae bacterium]
MQPQAQDPDPAPAVLILFCEEGNGHASAAQTLALELRERGAQVMTRDAMQQGLGRVIPFFSRDTYRLQVRWLRWSYGVEYTLFTQVRPTRAIARRGLALFGMRPLRAVLAATSPDLVISTHPAVTNVLGRLCARGELTVPVVASITDFGVHPLWTHPAIDMHLVMHEALVPMVEASVGPGRVRVVRPAVAEEFRDPPAREPARRWLGIPDGRPLVVVSGGGWGVGDMEQIAEAVLEIPELEVLVLGGHNAPLRRRLESRHEGEARLRVLPFTNRMPEVLAAADALVDTTVGVTCLEAMATGRPIVLYGVPPGHSRENARTLSDLGLVRAPHSRRELIQTLLDTLADPQPVTAELPDGDPGLTTAGEAILDVWREAGRARAAADVDEQGRRRGGGGGRTLPRRLGPSRTL